MLTDSKDLVGQAIPFKAHSCRYHHDFFFNFFTVLMMLKYS